MESGATKDFMILVVTVIGIVASNSGKSFSFENSVGFVDTCRGNGIGSLRFKVVGLLVSGSLDEFGLKGSNNTLFVVESWFWGILSRYNCM